MTVDSWAAVQVRAEPKLFLLAAIFAGVWSQRMCVCAHACSCIRICCFGYVGSDGLGLGLGANHIPVAVVVVVVIVVGSVAVIVVMIVIVVTVQW